MRYGSPLTALAILGLIAAAAQAAPIPIEAVKRDKPVAFGEVRQILNRNCTACHSASKKESGLSLESRESILKGGNVHGPAVVAAKPGESILLKFASHSEEPQMPPKDNKVNAKNLTPAELGLIKLWIEQGAQAGGDAGAAKVEFQPLPPGVNPIFAVAISPDGRFAACGRANQIFIYHVPTGRIVCRLTDPAILKSGVYKNPGVAHLDLVQALAFSPDGLRLVSGGFQEYKTWTRPQNVQGFKAAVAGGASVIAISPDRKTLAAAGAGKNIQLFEAATGKPGKALAGHAAAVTALKFSPDGTKLFSGSADKTVGIWNVADGAAAGKIETLQPVAALTLIAGGKQVVTGGGDNSIYVWDLPGDKKPDPKEAKKDAKAKDAKDDGKPKPARTLAGHGQPVTSLETIAAAAPNDVQIISGSADGTLRQWNASNGQQVRSMNHGGPVVAVAARPDGQRFVSVSSNNTAKLWNATNGQAVTFNNQPDLKGDFRAQELAARLNDQLQMATAEVGTRKAAVDTAKKAAPPKAEGAKKAVEAQAAADKTLKEKQAASDKANGEKTAADKVVAQAQDAAKVAMTKATAADEAAKKDTKNEGFKKAKADADKLLADAKKAVTDAENKLKAADKPAADATKALNDAQAAFNSAKRTAELAALDVKAAKAAIPAAEAALKTMEDKQKKLTADSDVAKKAAAGSEQPFAAAAFSPDNLEVAVAGADKLIHTYSAETGQSIDVLAGSAAGITGLAYSADTALVSLSADNQLIGWSTNPEWALERTVGGDSQTFADRVIALAFSHDGKLLATGGGEPSRSGEVKLWEVASGKLVRALTDAHSDTVFGLEFSPDDTVLASCAADKFVKLHSVADGKWIKSFEGHTHHVLGVSWQANAKVLASCGADQVIKIWNVETGEQARTIQGFAKQFTALRYVGNKPEVIASSGDGNIHHRNENGNGVRTYASGAGLPVFLRRELWRGTDHRRRSRQRAAHLERHQRPARPHARAAQGPAGAHAGCGGVEIIYGVRVTRHRFGTFLCGGTTGRATSVLL